MSPYIVDICRRRGRCPLTVFLVTNSIVVSSNDNIAERKTVMRNTSRFVLFALSIGITACAPVMYEASYYDAYVPASRVAVSSTFIQTSVHRTDRRSVIQPIEITLYAESNYRGHYFQPVHTVLPDSGYVEIPIKDRRGQHTSFFIHYHQENLHFDSSRNCQGYNSYSVFKHDDRWKHGHKYTHINTDNAYDLTGLSLHVRNVQKERQQIVTPSAGFDSKNNTRKPGPNHPPKKDPLNHKPSIA